MREDVMKKLEVDYKNAIQQLDELYLKEKESLSESASKQDL